ncbi:hypothetical protein Tco_0509782 [Tanacetum coccineum]
MENSKREVSPCKIIKIRISQGAYLRLPELKRMLNVPYARLMVQLWNTKDMFLVYRMWIKNESTGFFLATSAVDWKSAKQSIFATSSAEAEYIAAFDASKEAQKLHTYTPLADPFTKALAFPKHSELTRNIGMLPASSLM